MYITLSKAKQHLNIESGYTEDDSYITNLIGVAESVVEKHINDSLTGITCSNGGILPLPLEQAMLLMIGNFYANREVLTLANVSKLPYNFEYLISFYQNYSN